MIEHIIVLLVNVFGVKGIILQTLDMAIGKASVCHRWELLSNNVSLLL